MERTVPTTASEEIDLYLRTIYSLLRSTSIVHIRTLEEVHAGMNSSLHPDARQRKSDIPAFIYTMQRLPDCITKVKTVLLGQSQSIFARYGFPDIETWSPVAARARRRRCFFDGKSLLACIIASRSDIDDIVPVLTAYQIEWNKLHERLQHTREEIIHQSLQSNDAASQLSLDLEVTPEDLVKLKIVTGESYLDFMLEIRKHKCDFEVRLMSGSLTDYYRATRSWWENIEHHCPDLLSSPVYFISSNTHSVVNLLSGFALQKKEELLTYLHKADNHELLDEWAAIKERNSPSNEENFFYYVQKKYQQTRDGKKLLEDKFAYEKKCGIIRIPSEHHFNVDAQVIRIADLKPDFIDSRLCKEDMSFLKKSNAYVLNIDYPLGLSAYNILIKLAEHISPILGVYIIGKSASLNGVIGDVMIPNVVHDEHSTNTYLFQNAFQAADVFPYLIFGSVLDNQKAVCVLGTFLQNARYMDVFYREGYTDIEMEAGPYLSAVYEMYRPTRHPTNEIGNLYGVGFDVGILHYVSDTPLNKAKNLAAGTMSYFGMDSTYASTIAVIRRIIELERKRISRD